MAKNGKSLDDLVVHLLHRVSQRADDPSQTDIVESTGIDRSTVAEMIRRMVKKGLLQRRRSRLDARAYVVRLTEAGQRALKSSEPQAQRAGTAVLASLGSEHRKTFIEALKAIATS